MSVRMCPKGISGESEKQEKGKKEECPSDKQKNVNVSAR